jgi:predicted membrane GTPase involved in stress response
MPTRGLLGLRNAMLTASRGTALLNTIFYGYDEWAGDISTREQGSLVRYAHTCRPSRCKAFSKFELWAAILMRFSD